MMTRSDCTPKRILFIICSFILVVSCVVTANAQRKDAVAATTAVQDATKKGFPLTSSSTDVTGNVSVEATLIPAKIARTVFGKEVANNYAVIALTISNRSSDDAFIVHTIFVDYSQWLLSGGEPWESTALCLKDEQDSKDAEGQQSAGQGNTQAKKCMGNRLQTWQQQTFANQISSVETRVVRGELLDRQPWTYRNWIIRALQGVGSIAAGFTFATSNQDWIHGIGAYNGHFIPAAQTFWPDATVGQMNRISDFGFQVNKVIAKQSSDIVVAFFPIDRFLTPDLKSIFILSPAAFFAPMAALMDRTTRDKLTPYINFIFGPPDIDDQKKPATGETATKYSVLENLKAHLFEVVSGACKQFNPPHANTQSSPGGAQLAAAGTQAAPGATQPPPAAAQPTPSGTQASPADTLRACQTAELVDRLSLNVVRVIVGGTMTVDVNKVPPQITEVDIDVPAGKDATTMWTLTDSKPTTLTGIIHGSFLGGATPTITNVDAKALDIKADSQASTDTELHFTITLKENLPTETTKLTFQVSKTSDSTTTKAAKDYTILTPPKTGSAPGTTTTEAKPQPVAPTGTSTAPVPPAPAPPNKH